MNLGLKFFTIQIAVIILYQTSNVIISQLYSPAEVTPYNIVYKYFSIIPMIFSIIISPLWSAFTEAWIKQDLIWVNNTMKKLKLVSLILSLLTIIMAIFANFMYKLWVGADLFIAFSLTLTMAIYVILNLWNGIYSQFLNGVGKIKLQLVIAIIGSVINIPLSIFLCKNIGNCGVILSTVIVSMPGIFIYPIQYKKIINQNATGIWAS